MLRLSASLLAGIVLLAGTASAQLLSNASLVGTYNFRYLGVNAGGTTDVPLSYQGTVTFNGKADSNGNGAFTVSGQGAGATAGPATNNIYQVLSNGLFYMTNPFDTTGNTFLSGGLGTGVIVASSTDTVYCDFLVAVPVATSASTAALGGNYWIASMDFLGGNFAQTRDTFFPLAADGKGGLGTNGAVTIKGTALNIGSTSPQVQTSTGATYTVSANGTGTMTFPAPSGVTAANQLLSGAKSLIVSQDGSFFVAGGTSGYDMIVGVKALTGSATNVANGLYFTSYLENFADSTGTSYVYGAVGAVNEIGSLGVEIGHQRANPDFTYSYDDTYGVSFAPAADGTVTYTSSEYVVGAGGNIVIGAGLSHNFQVAVYVKAPSVSGTGVFLNPQGLVNNATNVPFTAGVAPGEFLSLYGSGLASQTATAGALPFPTTLGGVQVAISWLDATSGKAQSAQAPVYFVSPGLVIILVPYTTPGDGSFLNFQVTNNGAPSNVATVYSGPTSPGIFTVPSGGIGNGAIEHAGGSLVSAASPANVGETVQIFLTGMGAVTPPVTAGAAAPASPLSQTILPDVYIDGVLATTVFSGLTPKAAGLYQLNVTIPAGVTTGATVTVEVDTFDSSNHLLSVNAQATIPISNISGQNPTPAITSLSPASATAGTSSLTLTINGNGFTASSLVTFGGVNHTASFISSGQLSIVLTSPDLSTAGSYPVIVSNSAPGGGASAPVNFSVMSAVPALQTLSLSATSVTGGGSAIGTVTLSSPAPTGGVQVTLSSDNSSAQVPASVTISSGQSSTTFTVTTTAVTSTQTATIAAHLGTSAATAVLTVAPGGSVSISITEYPVPTSASLPSRIAAGPDGALWFTENSGSANKIGRITTAGVVVEYPVPTPSSFPVGIAAGPDGALWFTESAVNKIGRITTTGVITEYPVPSDTKSVYGITAGPDGALWFAEGGKIGRITTSGAISEYPLATFSYIDGIAAGPDGALWFAETTGNKVGRITTAGVITEYLVPSSNSGPLGIAAGPDGALWFAESNVNKIGRITTAGVISEYPVPTPAGSPRGITAGPDGALWFTEFVGNKIGRITTAGVITEYLVPSSNSDPLGIAAGPDGALWFTEFSRIGRASLTTATAPALQMLTLSSTSVTGGGSLTGTVTLSSPAPAGGAVITLRSSGSAATVPANVTVAAGSSSATFNVTTSAVTSSQVVTITATYLASSQSATLTVSPQSSGLVLQGKSFVVNGTLTLSGSALQIEIQAVANSDGSHSIECDDELSAASSPIQFQFQFNSKGAVSGNTAVFTGPTIIGFYTDSSATIRSISSVTLSITFNSLTTGSSVTGMLTMVTSSGMIQGTFTGTLAAIG